ncbi:hypothetical protein E4T48_02488 [Aureobasidium sp. EXF-10727]|nr:hypothetical protein E4T48_02488 [Aureobasidium sp. EXF-10727]
MASEAYLRPPHPRRPPAQRSVSLKHHNGPSPSSKNTRSSQTEASSGSPSSNKPNVSKADSGESSNADKWFDGANNNADGKNSTLIDNDPPFFLQHSSSEETPNYGAPGATIEQRIPMHALMYKNDTEDSGSSDFRAVIDDLTVQNKKLKKRLKKYEKLHDAHLKDEKLFEVRVHGLSSTKRRELEDILRNFAVGAAAQTNAASASQTSNLYDRVVPTLKTHKTASSSSNFADSAYASNSASASASGTSNSNSGQQTRHPYRRSSKARTSNIQTYLHDIPEGLLPQHPAAMTEYSRKKLVVRRLEQIFAGTGAGMGDHHHPMQQQEVSQMAAKADRSALEATGQTAKTEGTREAPIMKDDEDRSTEETSGPEIVQGTEPDQKIAEKDFAGLSPQQRPTRPLDLDPHRAQNPNDNFQYIRHLGFSPPEPHTMQAHEEGHGWIYLNFLFNMAQLHTLNVTPEFAKKALLDFSTKFELSEDGRKVRWKGGRTITRSASDTDGSSPSTYGHSFSGTSPQKRSKSSHHNSTTKSAKRRMLEKQDNKFAYTPLFFHRSSEDDSDLSSEEDETESQFLAPPPGGDSSAMTSSGIRTVSLRQKKKTDNGPIIFYNNAKFCTDLSGEPKTEAAMMYNSILYHTTTEHALGIPKSSEATHEGIMESRGPLDAAEDLPEAMSLDDNPIPEALELNFPGTSPLSDASGAFGPARNPIDLEVSGIGGIYPSDNFSINVKTERKRNSVFVALPSQPKPYSNQIAGLFKESKQQPTVFRENVVGTFHQELPPSELPPASCFMEIDEYDDDESEFEDYHSMIPDLDRVHDVPATAPQTIDMPYMSSDESEDEDEEEGTKDDDAASDGSLDLLATARELDPKSIEAREREYDAHMAERLAEEIPAGSSAATAGGGSGFASPAAGVSRQEYEEARAQHAMRHASTITSVASFNKTDTNGSMIVNGKSP